MTPDEAIRAVCEWIETELDGGVHGNVARRIREKFLGTLAAPPEPRAYASCCPPACDHMHADLCGEIEELRSVLREAREKLDRLTDAAESKIGQGKRWEERTLLGIRAKAAREWLAATPVAPTPPSEPKRKACSYCGHPPNSSTCQRSHP